MNERFPGCGTEVEERNVANYLDPWLKGVHLVAQHKFEPTKALIIKRWAHLEGDVVENVQLTNMSLPMSPTSKLLMDVGGLVDDPLDVGRIASELRR